MLGQGRHSILFTIPNFITAGSGRAMLNIIERLDRNHFSPAVCVMKKGGRLDAEVERLGIPFIEASFTVRAKPYHSLPLRAWRAARVFRPYKFDLWHSFHYLDDYTEGIIARMAGSRAWIYTKKNMNWHRRSWYLRTLFATRVVAQNSTMTKEFFNRPFFRHAQLIARGVDEERFTPRSSQKQPFRKRSGVEAGAIVAACVAHLVPVKGHPTLLQALSQVPDMHLFLAGKPLEQAYASSLRSMAASLNIANRVHFFDDVRDVPELLAEVDIFVLPTWAQWRMEGCPVALLEAMACGRPCIATDIPGSRDIIEHGESGLLVPPENSNSLAEALCSLAGSAELRQKLSAGSRRRIVSHYTIDREVKQHQDLYLEILRNGNDGIRRSAH